MASEDTDRVVGYCKDCKKADYLDDMDGGMECKECGKPYKILQYCTKCNKWFSVPKETGQTCKHCGSPLRNPTVAQRKMLFAGITEDEPIQEGADGAVGLTGTQAAATEATPARRTVKKDGRKQSYEGDKLVYDSKFWDDRYSLKEGQTFKEYAAMIDKTRPYGEDKFGLAFLFPHKVRDSDVAWRFDMKYRCDWGSLRLTGVGWRVKPSLLILLAFFLPQLVLFPLCYVFFGRPDVYLQALQREAVVFGAMIALAMYFVRLIAYAEIEVDEIIKPYGSNHEYIQLLFKDELEYLKWSRKLSADTMDLRVFIPGLITFLGYLGYIVIWLLNTLVIYPESWHAGNVAPVLPEWCIILPTIMNVGIGLVLFIIVGFFGAVIYGLFKIGGLAVPYKMEKKPGNIHYKDALAEKILNTKKRSVLSISSYATMIRSIQEMLTEAQLNRERVTKMVELLDKQGKTYYEFQRGNRRIGEYLFNIATLLIVLCVAAATVLWLVSAFNLVPGLEANIFAFSIGLFCFAILSFCMFLLPQFNLHKYLKMFKLELIDSFSFILSRLEYIYFEAMIEPTILKDLNMGWENRPALLKDMEFIKKTITDVKSYGTWSYDFPEIMKLVVVALSTTIPILLGLFQG
ncbi:MAG: hypothetical protein JW839_00055 [Candidatus Lokiarchaeota archaeon]|nr:hypothetical protein [Candidatus Lokiarchaeota archaeon]